MREDKCSLKALKTNFNKAFFFLIPLNFKRMFLKIIVLGSLNNIYFRFVEDLVHLDPTGFYRTQLSMRLSPKNLDWT